MILLFLFSELYTIICILLFYISIGVSFVTSLPFSFLLLRSGTSVPVRSTGRPALRRLLDRIREQRDQWGRPEPLQSQEISATDSTSDKISPVIDHEWQQSSSLEEGTADTPTPTSQFHSGFHRFGFRCACLNYNHVIVGFLGSKMSDDSIVAGSIKQPEDALTEVAVQVCASCLILG